MVARTTTAMSGGQFVRKPPAERKKLSPSWIVKCSRSRSRMSGQKNAFHVPWNWRIVTAASAGPASGSMIRQYVLK